jgi:hypothetical protein
MTYEEHRAALLGFLHSCLERGDFHGVSDAANDLRELQAEQRGKQSADMPDYVRPLKTMD